VHGRQRLADPTVAEDHRRVDRAAAAGRLGGAKDDPGYRDLHVSSGFSAAQIVAGDIGPDLVRASGPADAISAPDVTLTGSMVTITQPQGGPQISVLSVQLAQPVSWQVDLDGGASYRRWHDCRVAYLAVRPASSRRDLQCGDIRAHGGRRLTSLPRRAQLADRKGRIRVGRWLMSTRRPGQIKQANGTSTGPELVRPLAPRSRDLGVVISAPFPGTTVVMAKDLSSTKQRKKLSKESFALPGKRKYPIPDKAHARNALARVAQHGTPAEQKKVEAAVKKRYPSLDKNSKKGQKGSKKGSKKKA
jgi:hypothetical protein